MEFYHIRTMIAPHRTSLVTMAPYSCDVAAIAAARQLIRQGEVVEVWRDETLVYRYAANVVQMDRPKPVAQAVAQSGPRRRAWPSLKPKPGNAVLSFERRPT